MTHRSIVCALSILAVSLALAAPTTAAKLQPEWFIQIDELGPGVASSPKSNSLPLSPTDRRFAVESGWSCAISEERAERISDIDRRAGGNWSWSYSRRIECQSPDAAYIASTNLTCFVRGRAMDPDFRSLEVGMGGSVDRRRTLLVLICR